MPKAKEAKVRSNLCFPPVDLAAAAAAAAAAEGAIRRMQLLLKREGGKKNPWVDYADE